MNAQLTDLVDQIDRASRDASGLAEALGADRLAARPAPEAWSPAENLAHLSLTTRAFLPLFDAALAEARERDLRSDGSYKMDLWGRFLRWSLEPPPRFRVKTTAPFQPVEVEPVAEVLPSFLALQEELRKRVEAADGLAVDRVKIVSPFSSSVKYNVFSAFTIALAHERRHLWQASQSARNRER
jgi:hypothetical protein